MAIETEFADLIPHQAAARTGAVTGRRGPSLYLVAIYAILVLAAAEETGRDQSVVRTSSGVFYVPADLAEKAGVEVMKETGHGW